MADFFAKGNKAINGYGGGNLASKSDIAYVESGTTASRAYTLGQLIYVNGSLYRAKTAIASGTTFTVDTNIELTSISDELTSISDEVKGYTILKTISSTTATSVTIPNEAKELLVVLKTSSNVIYASVTIPKELFSNTMSLKNPADTSKEVYKSENKWKVTDAQYRGVIYYR